MTDRDLLALYHKRMAKLEAMKLWRGPLKNMDPEYRAELEKISRAFWAADRAITEELIARGKPARLNGVTLWLTHDLRNFAALEPGEQSVKGWPPSCNKNTIPGLLCTY
jgi:hypothetical protein